MFTTSQQLWLKVAITAVIVFFLARVGGAEGFAAFIWGLLVAFVLFLVLRQNIVVAGESDPMPAVPSETIEQARSYVSNTVSTSASDETPKKQPDREETESQSEKQSDAEQESKNDTQPEMSKPTLLDAPRGGGADDLKRISGVGPKLEIMLNDLGVYHFEQIAAWSDKELNWIDDALDTFKGRAARDNWIEQARALSD